jgi:hypothetical protein
MRLSLNVCVYGLLSLSWLVSPETIDYGCSGGPLGEKKKGQLP